MHPFVEEKQKVWIKQNILSNELYTVILYYRGVIVTILDNENKIFIYIIILVTFQSNNALFINRR